MKYNSMSWIRKRKGIHGYRLGNVMDNNIAIATWNLIIHQKFITATQRTQEDDARYKKKGTRRRKDYRSRTLVVAVAKFQFCATHRMQKPTKNFLINYNSTIKLEKKEIYKRTFRKHNLRDSTNAKGLRLVSFIQKDHGKV